DEFYSFFNLRADVDSDGQVGPLDLFEFHPGWRASPPMSDRLDVNVDGRVNDLDLEVVLKDWKRGTGVR
ncbi:MAG: hypothetical protein KC994_13260, partial [Candidatus Omnitrophica bacterium]|nr:hypothetical protein [Candidatus Omnitrophota bacterium]